MEEFENLRRRLEDLNLGTMNQENQEILQRSNKKTVNDPPPFSGNKREFDGFLTRVEVAMEDNPQGFVEDQAKVRFVISYLIGYPLTWASNLRRNHDPILNSYDDFIRELRNQFGEQDMSTIVANGKLCSIRQHKFGHVSEYINEFNRISRNSDFNESAKIYMFVKGLHYKMREHLAVVNPNPNNLRTLFTDVLSIESLTKRHDINEFFYHSYNHRNDNNQDSTNDPMEVDLYRIKKGQKNTSYFPSSKSPYIENETSKKKYWNGDLDSRIKILEEEKNRSFIKEKRNKESRNKIC